MHLPVSWQATEDNECVTLLRKHSPSAVQISAARKETGFITDEELKEFAAERLGDQISLCKVNTPEFTGFCAEYIKNSTFWREWWLRSNDLIVYVTYNIDVKYREAELGLVDEIIRDLRPIGSK